MIKRTLVLTAAAFCLAAAAMFLYTFTFARRAHPAFGAPAPARAVFFAADTPCAETDGAESDISSEEERGSGISPKREPSAEDMRGGVRLYEEYLARLQQGGREAPPLRRPAPCPRGGRPHGRHFPRPEHAPRGKETPCPEHGEAKKDTDSETFEKGKGAPHENAQTPAL